MKISWKLTVLAYRIRQKLFWLVMRLVTYPKQTVFSEHGDLQRIPEILAERQITSVFVACSKSVRASGALDSLFAGLDGGNIRYTVFTAIQQNATTDNVMDGIRVYADNTCAAIVAIGGGSVLDCAKIIGLSVANPSLACADMKKMSAIKKRMPLFIAVPTTAGTGSESSLGAVVTDTKTKEKYPIISLHNMCDYVVLDETLTLGLPESITAYTGMDALTHAIEAYIGTYGTRYTNAEALTAIKLIFENLPLAVKDGQNVVARRNMLLASNHAANAFTRAYTGYVHTISHACGALYNLNHGKTNSTILPLMLRFYGKTVEKKLARIAVYAGLGNCTDNSARLADRLIAHIELLNKQFNIPSKIAELKTEDIPIIAKKALAEGNPAYPVPKIMNYRECCAFIEKLLL